MNKYFIVEIVWGE